MVRHSKGGMIVAVIVVLWVLGMIGKACGVDDTSTDTDTPAYVDDSTDSGDLDGDVQDLALETAWDEMGYSGQRDLCDNVDLFGVEKAAAIINRGADYQFDQSTIESFLLSKC